ncbi:uncharacterized protein TNCV_2648401 [Trichonephila clavipes]|nr:uncharacterized protein TNCV_2648401 [Trichonephila clavipes]
MTCLIRFVRRWKRFRINLSCYPFGACAMDWGSVKIQHRHMILACEQESSFADVWKGKIRYEFPNSGRAKKCIKRKSAFHLVRTIMYVSQPKSSCDKDLNNLKNPEQLSHFHINRPLHPHSIAFSVLYFQEG